MTRTGLAKVMQRGMMKLYAEVMEVSSYQHNFSDPVPTICLKDIRIDPARTVTDHAWIQPKSMYQNEVFPRHLEVGDVVSFVACVGKYEKGIFGHKRDYGLVNIKSVEVISKGNL